MSLATGPCQSRHNADSENITRLHTAGGHHGPTDNSSATFIQRPIPVSGGRPWSSQDSSNMRPPPGQADLVDPLKVRFWTQDAHGSTPQHPLGKIATPKSCIPQQFSSSPSLRAGGLGRSESAGLSTVGGASSAARYWSSAAHTDVSRTGLGSPGAGPAAVGASSQDSSGDGSGAVSRTRPRPRQVPRDDSLENDDHNDHADDSPGDTPNELSGNSGEKRYSGTSSTATSSDGLRRTGLENGSHWLNTGEDGEQVDQWWRGDDDFSDSERE